MDWFAPVDIYCERLGPGFWAEPWNAVSNAAFLIAAAFGAATARRRGADAAAWLLIGLAACIGVGSFLFHTFANRWSELADVLPIWSFVAAYIVATVARLRARAPRPAAVVAIMLAAIAVIVFLAMGEGPAPNAAAMPTPPDPLNGSLQYAPAVIAMLVFAVIFQIRRHPLRHWLFAAIATFLLSLTFRTLDRDICVSLPLGTHFLWHMLNGAMIGLLLQMFLRFERPASVIR